jgi:hypothetical protein
VRCPSIDLSFEDDLGQLLRLGNGVERLLCKNNALHGLEAWRGP